MGFKSPDEPLRNIGKSWLFRRLLDEKGTIGALGIQAQRNKIAVSDITNRS